MEACANFDGNLNVLVCYMSIISQKNVIFNLSLLYFNNIARNVRIVQNEKLYKCLFCYEDSLCRALEEISPREFRYYKHSFFSLNSITFLFFKIIQ